MCIPSIPRVIDKTILHIALLDFVTVFYVTWCVCIELITFFEKPVIASVIAFNFTAEVVYLNMVYYNLQQVTLNIQ